MIKYLVPLLIIFSLVLSTPVLAAEPVNGTIKGSVVNGTAGGDSVAGLSVTLKTYVNDSEVASATAKTNAAGEFIFENLSTGTDYSYQVVLIFQGADYYSERLDFIDGEAVKTTEVVVYNSTTSDEVIKVMTAHTIVYVEQGTLRVKDYYLFVNTADRTYIGSSDKGNEGTLRFALPKEATELQITFGLMECCLIKNEREFIDTMPVLPGSREVAYSYKVKYNSGSYTFSQKLNYPMANFDLLIQDAGNKVSSRQLTAGEPMNIRGSQFYHLSRKSLAPGYVIMAELSGLPNARSQGPVIWVIIVLVALAIGFGFVFMLRRRKLQPVSLKDSFDYRRQALLGELAQLDDDFEEGNISEDIYRKLRATKKAQLIELQRSKGSTVTENGES